VDVRLERHFPLFVADVADVLERGQVSSVVNQNVDTAQFVDRFPDDVSAMVGALQIG
jgi:hypothetical protein